MKFPKWAPQELTEEYLRTLEERRIRQEFDDEIRKENLALGETRDRETLCRAGDSDFEKREQSSSEILLRLLTRKEMEGVWKALKKAKPADNLRSYMKTEISSGRGLLWRMIKPLEGRYSYLIKNGRTGAEKKKGLSALVTQAKKLMGLIRADHDARLISNDLVKSSLIRAWASDHEQVGGTIPAWIWSELDLDVQAARRESNSDDGIDQPLTPWHRRAPIERVTYWAESAGALTFESLLNDFIDLADREAVVPPIIKQPGRGEGTKKAYYCHELHNLFMYFYGQPYDEHVAALVTAILDLKVGLDRDDVRPYLRTGKKSKKLG